MKVKLTGQAQEFLGQSELVVITERVDDVALLLGHMMKMGLPEILDTHLPRHFSSLSGLAKRDPVIGVPVFIDLAITSDLKTARVQILNPIGGCRG